MKTAAIYARVSSERQKEEQTIGRAARFRSHSHLPKPQQRVDVYHLTLIKPVPGTKGRPKGDDKPSADILLQQLVSQKEEKRGKFEKRLRNLSVEKDKKCR